MYLEISKKNEGRSKKRLMQYQAAVEKKEQGRKGGCRKC